MKYLIFAGLFFYGLFYHITSSEFWPVTISRTWFHWDQFEYSMLQKPLLTFLLSFVHLFPFSDSQHIWFVKIVFSALGTSALFLFAKLAITSARFSIKGLSQSNLIALLALILFIVSPIIRNNYFCIRSDQLAFLLFSIFMLECELDDFPVALGILLVIPLCGIKELLFIPPGIMYLGWSFKRLVTIKMIFFAALSSLAILVWIMALNPNSLTYLQDTAAAYTFTERLGPNGLQSELPMLLMALLSIFGIFVFRLIKFYKLAVLSLFFLMSLLLIPQAFSFFLASIIPFVALPLFVLLLQIKESWGLRLFPLATQLSFVFYYTYNSPVPAYLSNREQFQFINSISEMMNQYHFSYLDGAGVFPKQKFHPCFSSPNDDNANSSCLARIRNEKPEVLIVTKRLFAIGEVVFQLAQESYTQIFPNVWILNSKVSSALKEKTDLSGHQPIPIIIF